MCVLDQGTAAEGSKSKRIASGALASRSLCRIPLSHRPPQLVRESLRTLPLACIRPLFPRPPPVQRDVQFRGEGCPCCCGCRRQAQGQT